MLRTCSHSSPDRNDVSHAVPAHLRRAVLAVALVGAGLWLFGCAAVAPKTPEQIVAERAAERWKLMMADKFEGSYELTAPSYRALKDFKAYRLNYGPAKSWVSSEVVKVTCASAASCTAVLKVTIKNSTPIRGLPTLTTALDENWVLEDGRWYFLPAL